LQFAMFPVNKVCKFALFYFACGLGFAKKDKMQQWGLE
jgi:hypothetical protein